MPNKLPYDKFLESLKLSPRLVIELALLDKSRRVLLVRRTTEPFVGCWHIPGGFLLKDEKIADCVKRLLREELNIKQSSTFKYVSLIEDIDGDPRGHILHYVVEIVESDPMVGEFFDVPPDKVMPKHKEILIQLGYWKDSC